MDPIYHYRSTLDHDLLRQHLHQPRHAIPLDAEFIVLGREKNSHLGSASGRG